MGKMTVERRGVVGFEAKHERRAQLVVIATIDAAARETRLVREFIVVSLVWSYG
jgi:hypothetical protein